jgi:hypothetical protein
MPSLELPRQAMMRRLERRKPQVVVVVIVLCAILCGLELVQVVLGEEGRAGIPLEAFDKVVPARGARVCVVGLAHAVGAAMREGLLLELEIVEVVELDVSRGHHLEGAGGKRCMLFARRPQMRCGGGDDVWLSAVMGDVLELGLLRDTLGRRRRNWSRKDDAALGLSTVSMTVVDQSHDI